MRLEFDRDPSVKYPNGYWYAATSNGDYDADGATPLDAVSSLAITLEQALYARSVER